MDGQMTMFDWLEQLKELGYSLGEKIRHGEWVELDSNDACYYCCCLCGKRSDFKENYCPNCGAHMDERTWAKENGMNDCIYRQEAINAVRSYYDEFDKRKESIEERIEQIPAADVVEVVRCCKCEYWDRETLRHQSNDFRDWNEAECMILAERDCWHEINRYTEADDYCSCGSRRDG